MTKNEIARDTIRKGLNICSEALGVDGSAVIPSIVGMVLEEIGSCKECIHRNDVNICTADGTGQDYVGNILEWYCPKFERNENDI
jgi:hypothetical protein